MKVAIIGTGKIGCDLLAKIVQEPKLKCELFLGRRDESEGIKFAKSLNIRTATNGISAIDTLEDPIDLLFDATSALEHEKNQSYFVEKKAHVINLTPANINFKCVPTINIQDTLHHKHISMITCGGQAVVPIAVALTKSCKRVDYLEAVTSISSESAGPGTRQNIGQYQEITETAIKSFASIATAKSILIINPAKPCIPMQTTIYAKAEGLDLAFLKNELTLVVNKICQFIPGYRLLSEPMIDDNRVVIMIKVLGTGNYLPTYAGNLDIITSAAVNVAKYIADNRVC